MQFFLQSNSLSFTILNRYQPTQFGKATGGSQVNRYFSGTLYIPSAVAEVAPNYTYKNKLTRLIKAFGTLYPLSDLPAAVSTRVPQISEISPMNPSIISLLIPHLGEICSIPN